MRCYLKEALACISPMAGEIKCFKNNYWPFMHTLGKLSTQLLFPLVFGSFTAFVFNSVLCKLWMSALCLQYSWWRLSPFLWVVLCLFPVLHRSVIVIQPRLLSLGLGSCSVGVLSCPLCLEGHLCVCFQNFSTSGYLFIYFGGGGFSRRYFSV